jgi:hypothetical protein
MNHSASELLAAPFGIRQSVLRLTDRSIVFAGL